MRYLDFKISLEQFPVFAYSDIQKVFPAFDRRRLVEWQKKGYLKRVMKGIYYFSDNQVNEAFIYFISNRIYKPSYISLQTALAYYNLIPEGVYLSTGISTRNTRMLETTLGNFEYRHVKPELFFGYRLIEMNGKMIKMAEPEKLILDYCYFNKVDDLNYVESLRINRIIGNELLDLQKLRDYQRIYNSPIINKRVKLFIEYLHAKS
jgi:predicted transcriptional regulator of viral defense system